MQKSIIAVKLCLLLLLVLTVDKAHAEWKVEEHAFHSSGNATVSLGDYEVSVSNGEISTASVYHEGKLLKELEIDLAEFTTIYTWNVNNKGYVLLENKKQGTGGFMQFTVIQLADGELKPVYVSDDYKMGSVNVDSDRVIVTYAAANESLVDNVTLLKDTYTQDDNGSLTLAKKGEKQTVAKETVRESFSFQSTGDSNILGENPTNAELNMILTQEAIIAGVPPELVKAIAWQESSWRQFRTTDDPNGLWKKGDPVVSFDGGIGIMQITESNMTADRELRLKEDIRYNIQEGLRILKEKWNYNSWGRIPKINGNDMNVIEDWYFAVMAYNGISRRNDPQYYPDNTYQDVIYRHIERMAQLTVTKFPELQLRNDIYYNEAGSLLFRKNHYYVSGPFTTSKHFFANNDLVKATESGVRLRKSPEGAEIRLTTAGETLQIVGPYQAGNNSNNHFVWYPVKDMSSKETYYIASTYLDNVRISGPNRYATAVSISKTGWDKADTVVLARGDNFPDALAGTPLAYKLNAPILLTKKNELTEETKNELVRLGAKNVVILGGTGAITDTVSTSVRNMGIEVKRIAGANRFETAKLIANEMGTSFSTAVVVNAYGFPDALAIAPYAARNGIPILLTEKNYIPGSTKTILNSASKTIVVGGTAVVNQNLLSAMPKATRISGATRYETAYKIGTQFSFSSSEGLAVSGTDFPDALTGSVLAAKRNAPLLLVNPTYLPEETLQLARARDFSQISILGGTSAVRTDTVINLVK
ncbi:transglycosylase SLT domain-containing protein [Sutcliffiella horikoshii]|uniref:Transglycosylase SLT domain-containing protein n=1 Tax=Sutcliffiella horikoshii TaxID=79883 RepID=A0AA94WPE5_9BACI|nr:cell wall-binding repeat-containing protein [Sutcliffiella horikoshii]TYS59968.1 transglycosylase SLT domain-containing protein [Sutcliffiella horikoshii]